jgi:N-acyl-D-aspartate/D-glutamate deacylase
MLALSRNESIPLEPMKVSMKVDWETFPQYMDRISRLPLGINISHLYPIAPGIAYVMGGFDDAKKRFPNEKEMATIVRQFHEAMNAGRGRSKGVLALTTIFAFWSAFSGSK